MSSDTISDHRAPRHIADGSRRRHRPLLASAADFHCDRSGQRRRDHRRSTRGRPSCHRGVGVRGIPAVYSGDRHVLSSEGGRRLDVSARGVRSAEPRRGWCARRPRRCSSARRPKTLPTRAMRSPTSRGHAAAWFDLANKRGVAAVFEAARLEGMERGCSACNAASGDMTDLAHVCQLLQEAAHARAVSGSPACATGFTQARGQHDNADECSSPPGPATPRPCRS